MNITVREPFVRGSETSTIDSEIMQAAYEISVTVPALAAGPGPFTTLYVLDANWNFPLTSFIPAALHYSSELPPMVTVGIGYPIGPLTDPDSVRTYRERRTWELFEPGSGPKAAIVQRYESGGGATFLGALNEELVPAVESRYPADPAARVPFGDSAGAHFVLNALLNEPSAFAGWIAGSAGGWSDHWDELAARWQAAGPASLFLGVGREEAFLDAFPDLTRRLETLRERGLDLTTQIFDGETHVSAVWRNLTQGLRAVVANPGSPQD